MNRNELNANYRKWLREFVSPIWFGRGFDEKTGLFAENLDLRGSPTGTEHRSMVQARQIFSTHTFLKMGLADSDAQASLLKERALRSAHICIDKCQQPSGSYVQSIDSSYQIKNPEPVLYTQAFAIFGLAHAYQLSPNESFKTAAKRVVDYLKRERALPNGGYSELIGGKTLFQSNPHMHLFEAAIEWLEVAPEKVWEDLADELFALAKDKFYQKESGALCEHFDEQWKPQLQNGDFFFEPGHHYEWAWLALRFGSLRKVDTFEFAHSLHETADKYGVEPAKNLAYDEVWSSKAVKKPSSRIWPQCERVKSAVLLAERLSEDSRSAASAVADSAIVAIQNYLKTDPLGFWFEFADENGQFHYQPGPVAKASTLYHIIGALEQHDSVTATRG
jgi:mannose/cellobiose epimerase-like protein (N-acyl-D-glucosamine 2-epimerase family)